MANEENLIPLNRRNKEEVQKICRAGGKASGEARRRKADFRKTLNMLLTSKIEDPELTPMLKEMGVDSTLEAAVNAAMIKAAMQGDVKAFVAIRDTIGQTTKSDTDLEEQKIRIAKEKISMPKKEENVDSSIQEMEEYFERRKKESP